MVNVLRLAMQQRSKRQLREERARGSSQGWSTGRTGGFKVDCWCTCTCILTSGAEDDAKVPIWEEDNERQLSNK